MGVKNPMMTSMVVEIDKSLKQEFAEICKEEDLDISKKIRRFVKSEVFGKRNKERFEAENQIETARKIISNF